MNDRHPSGSEHSPAPAPDADYAPYASYDQQSAQYSGYTGYDGYGGYPTGTTATGAADTFENDPLFGDLPGGSASTYGTGQWTIGTQAVQHHDPYAGQQRTDYGISGHDTGAYGIGGQDTTGAWAVPEQQLPATAGQSGTEYSGQWDATAWSGTGQWETSAYTAYGTQAYDARTYGAPAADPQPQDLSPLGPEPRSHDFGTHGFDTGTFQVNEHAHPDAGSPQTRTFDATAFANHAAGTQTYGSHSFETSTFDAQAYETQSFDAQAYETQSFEARTDQAYAYEHRMPAEDRPGESGHSDGIREHDAEIPGESGLPDDRITAEPQAGDHAEPYGLDEDTTASKCAPAPPAPVRTASRSRARRRSPAKRSALLTVAVPSVCVMGVAGIAAASVEGLSGDDTKDTTASASDATAVKPSVANKKLDTQLKNLSADAGDFADRASRTQERIDLKARQDAERKEAAKEAARKERLRPKFVMPVKPHGLSAYFGQAGVNWMSVHTGIDFPVSFGTPVMAATDGTLRTQWNSAYGNMAIVTAKDGTETWYCHLSSYRLPSGSTVKAGDQIAFSGSSGNSTGPHMHFEVRPGGGAAIDPLPWLRSHGIDPT